MHLFTSNIVVGSVVLFFFSFKLHLFFSVLISKGCFTRSEYLPCISPLHLQFSWGEFSFQANIYTIYQQQGIYFGMNK